MNQEQKDWLTAIASDANRIFALAETMAELTAHLPLPTEPQAVGPGSIHTAFNRIAEYADQIHSSVHNVLGD